MASERRARALAAALAIAACAGPPAPAQPQPPASDGALNGAQNDALLDDLEHRTFDFFWRTADPTTHLVPDRFPTPSFSSIAAVGFGLTAYAIGAERGYVSRTDASGRVLATLRFLRDAPQGDAAHGMTGYR